MQTIIIFFALLIFFEYCNGGVLIVPALGRTADFGDIYDARTNKFTRDNIFKQTLPQNFKTLIENPYTRYDFTSAKSSSEKLNAFEITGELKLQIMCGVVDIGGSAKYLTDNKYTSHHVVSTYILKSKIAKETFNWKEEDLKTFMDFTHVVVGIQYGGNGVVTLSQTVNENTDHQNIQAKLDATVKIFNNAGVSGSLGGNFNSTAKESSAEDDLTTLAGTYTFMKKLSGRLLQYNNKKGVQISFEMIPLTVISKFFTTTSPQIVQYSPLSIHHFSSINHKLIKLENLVASFNERYFELEKNRIYFNYTEQEWFDEIKAEFDRNVSILLERIDKDIIAFHNHSIQHDEISKKELHINPLKRHVEKFREESEVLIEKLNFIKYAMEKGSMYVDTVAKLEDVKRRHNNILFCFLSKSNQKRFSITIKSFATDCRCNNGNATYVIVNADKFLNSIEKEILFSEHSYWPIFIYKFHHYYVYQYGSPKLLMFSIGYPFQECTEQPSGNKTCITVKRTVIPAITDIPLTKIIKSAFTTSIDNQITLTPEIYYGNKKLGELPLPVFGSVKEPN